MATAIPIKVPNLFQLVVDDTAQTAEYQTYASGSWTTQWTLDLATGHVKTAQATEDNESLHSLSGATAGTIYWSMPQQGTSTKRVAIYLDGYENDTSNADTITFPTAFTYTPHLNNAVNVSGATVSASELQLDPNSTTTYTGWIFLEGF